LYADGNDAVLLLKTAPIYAWGNKFYSHVDHQCYQAMSANWTSNFQVCEGALDINVLNFGNVLPHWDIKLFPALLSYLGGPWRGGEIHVAELWLIMVTQPRDEILLDLILIHHVGVVTSGVQYNVTSYHGGINNSSIVIPSSEWMGAQHFGFTF